MIIRELYGALYRYLLFPLFEDVVKKRNIYSQYKEMSGNPYLDKYILWKMQNEKLRMVVEYAYENVPFYKALFDEKGVELSKVNSISYLADRGIETNKEMLKSAGSDSISKQYDKSNLVRKFTSGTTGTPFKRYITKDTWCHQVAMKYRAEDWFGKHIGSPTTYIWGHSMILTRFEKLKYYFYWWFRNNQFLSAFNMDEDNLIRYIKFIKRSGSRYIESYVSSVYMMARVIEKRNISPPKLDGIVIGGERLFEYQKNQIESSFGCPVFNRYGCSEFMNVACECSRHRGLHINADNYIVEVLDDQGNPVFDKVGELVITDLSGYAMPLIRYRIGDKAILSSRSCDCGRSFPMLEDVIGRGIDEIVTPNGERINGMYIHWKLREIEGIHRYKAVQKTDRFIRIMVETGGMVDNDILSEIISKDFLDLHNRGIEIEIDFVDRIPPSKSGKMKFFVSEVHKSEKN